MELMERTMEQDAKQWLFSMMNTLKQEDLTLCLVTLWAIWFARHKAIHEGSLQSPLSTHLFVESFISDLNLVPKNSKKSAATGHDEVPKWIVLPRGYVKINVDVVIRKDGGLGALAAVCRTDDETYLGASTIVVRGISDPAVLEALACREALALASDLQATKIKIASNCIEAVHSLEKSYLGKLSSIARETNLRALEFDLVLFVHEN
jgi:hypothetical protein